MFYNIQNNNAPMYLCDLIPPSIQSTTVYPLRNGSDIIMLFCRLSNTYDSFIPSTELKKYIERNDLIDIWRARNPNSKCFTFGRVNSHSRIDFIFFSSELNFASQKIKIIHFPLSDHDGVIMTLKVNEPERFLF
jgi:hypothetical protein